MWSLSLSTTYVREYEGAVQYCTCHIKVKAVPATKVTLHRARLSWNGK
jgi:hypothetical protein